MKAYTSDMGSIVITRPKTDDGDKFDGDAKFSVRFDIDNDGNPVPIFDDRYTGSKANGHIINRWYTKNEAENTEVLLLDPETKEMFSIDFKDIKEGIKKYFDDDIPDEVKKLTKELEEQDPKKIIPNNYSYNDVDKETFKFFNKLNELLISIQNKVEDLDDITKENMMNDIKRLINRASGGKDDKFDVNIDLTEYISKLLDQKVAFDAYADGDYDFFKSIDLLIDDIKIIKKGDEPSEIRQVYAGAGDGRRLKEDDGIYERYEDDDGTYERYENDNKLYDDGTYERYEDDDGIYEIIPELNDDEAVFTAGDSKSLYDPVEIKETGEGEGVTGGTKGTVKEMKEMKKEDHLVLEKKLMKEMKEMKKEDHLVREETGEGDEGDEEGGPFGFGEGVAGGKTPGQGEEVFGFGEGTDFGLYDNMKIQNTEIQRQFNIYDMASSRKVDDDL